MQSDLHPERCGTLGRVIPRLGSALLVAFGSAGTPLFAQHEGHQMPGSSGEMPGMPGPNPIEVALPWPGSAA